MKKTNTPLIILLFAILALFALNNVAVAQTPNQNIPYSYQFYQKLNSSVYDINSSFHSSIRGFYADDSVLVGQYQSLMKLGVDSLNKRSWIRRKLTDEHLVNFKGDDYNVYLDFLPDFQIGREFKESKTTWLNTRGFQIGGDIGKQFSFYASAYENQGVFANYVTDFINTNQVVPSEMTGKLDGKTKDWSYATALLSFTANKHLNLALGYDKNFIGDGYRSMLLSDVAANYSFLRMRATLGNVQYQTIFAYMLDPGAERFTTDRRLGDRGKWMAAHYLDWNITKRFSAGFFQAVTWADAEKEGKRGFDFNYAHPFIFLRSVESANTTSPDKMRLGVNLKYEILDKTTVYGQFMFDEFTAKEIFSSNGYWANKHAIQVGFRGSDLFKVPRLNYLAEFNTAKPYTYAHFDRVSNYAAMNQPLAHPFGANFREFLGLLNYSYKRFDFQGQMIYANYGADPAGLNYGKNIFLSYETRVQDYGVSTGQGIKTNLFFTEAKVSYLINPKYNLRAEIGGIIRRESSSLSNQNTGLVTFGLRSTFRNLYRDF
ncbi:gliding motility protein RemB [Pedobacter sp. CFBP9032]|uniref:gliding motility protein RemB n=1 Tax=Pedobacter sp. CFBP9032 TaxID=3096539 RepID=UPI002A698F5C|nr:gliding motility protein RemB [Pedobacter sp. CFBP9032]MDY0907186.1 gliding motility protein RemB [Pedobacter sp. CFBP9032]